MTLIDEWKDVLKKAWSVRLMLLSAIFGAMEVALPQFAGLLPERTFAALSTVAAVGAFAARLLTQKNMEPSSDA